ncbi:MAG: restriction endonuclease subunit S [Syntrophales bacterium]
MIDLRSDFLDTLKRLLAEIVPDCEVRIFGSRYNWTATDASDLDLALVGPGKLHWKTLARLKAALEESSLPYRVDVLDWRAISPEFQKVIEQGYEVIQKPELGMSSKGWETTFLGDIAEIIMGQSPAGETCNEIGNGIPLLNGPTEFGNSHPNPVQYTIDSKKFSEPGDLLFCVRGSTTGKMNWADRQYAIGRGLAALRHKKGKDYQAFLRGIIDYYLPVLLAEATGSTFPNVSGQQLSQLSIGVPPLPAQRRIAGILSALDEKIELNRQTNATLEAIAQAIFKEWFVDFNFPGATGEMVESELGMIPRGWRMGTLGEIVEVKGGTTPSTKEEKFWNGEYHWATPKDLSNLSSPILLTTERKITAEGVKQIGSGILPAGTLLLSSRAPIGYLAISDIPVSINQGFIAINAKATSNLFVLHWLKKNMETVISRANGSTFLEITKTNFREIEFVIPDAQIAQMFDKVIAPIFEQIKVNEQESITLATLRDALLPKLMNGEIPVGANDYSPLQTTQQPPRQPVPRRQPTPQSPKVSGR